MLSRRSFLRTAGACASFAAGLGYYTWRIEPEWLEIVQRPLPIRSLPSRLIGRRLVHLSDLHVGPRVSDDYLLDTFQRIRALHPDIVVITGDLMSWHRDASDHLNAVYRHFPHGRLATVATLGNHDYGSKWAQLDVASEVAGIAEACGIRVLRNELLDVEGLQIVGLDDLWAKRFDPHEAFTRLDADRAAIALTHNPDTVDLPGWERFEGWIFAGHTHGGQCKPPFLPPPVLPVQNRRYTSGAFRLAGNRHMYISRGVGNVLPVRFNARPEATVFELQPTEA
jgi:uncharacterized protein